MSTTKKRIEEKALTATADWDDNPVDLSHLIGYKEMSVKEIHFSTVEGPNNGDPGFCIVLQDEVGNNRIARISREQLQNTLNNIDWDIVRY